MEGLEALKAAVCSNADTSGPLERCYAELLDDYNQVHATIFMNLLEMVDRSPRVEEMLRVMDFIRFPVKKSI